MTDQEINAKYSAKKMHQSDFEEFKDEKAHTMQKIENEDLVNDPVVVDWRTANILPPILNQGNCGSCWTFAAASVAEAEYNRKYRTFLQFSPQ
jgi:C1A family cysteine protease